MTFFFLIGLSKAPLLCIFTFLSLWNLSTELNLSPNDPASKGSLVLFACIILDLGNLEVCPF